MKIEIKDKYFLPVAILLSVLTINIAYAQSSYHFKQFPLPQDLPRIYTMYEDHRGFIWLGTAEGLYRFDGINYSHFTGNDSQSGPGHEIITYFLEDDQQNLWIGARSGIYRYRADLNTFEKFAFADEVYAYYIHQENDSCFLVQSVSGIFWFYPSSDRWVKLDVGIPDNKIYTVLRGRADEFWIGTDDFVRKYSILDKTVKDFFLHQNGHVSADEKLPVNYLFMDSRDQLWINTWFKGVIRLDTKTGNSVFVDTLRSDQDPYLLELFNGSMTEDNDGNIWIASASQGINIYRAITGTISHITKGADFGFGLIGIDFAIISDRANNKWVKSDRALHYLSHTSPVPVLVSDPVPDMQDALTILFPAPDIALLGTNHGLYQINLKTKVVRNFNAVIHLPDTKSAETHAINDILPAADQVYWLTTPLGLRKIQYHAEDNTDTNLILQNEYASRPDFWPSKLIAVNDTTIFVKGRSNWRTFAMFTTTSGTYTYHDLPDSLQLNQVAAFRKDTLIFGVRNKGIYHYSISGQSFEFIPWKFEEQKIKINKPVFYSILALKDGLYALSTENFGVILYNPVTRVFDKIEIADLANTNIVYGTEEDALGNLWIEASNQLLYYERSTGKLSKLNLSASFKGKNPAWFLRDGKEIYATFEGGLYKMPMDHVFTKKDNPKLYPVSIRIGDQELDWNQESSIRLDYANNFVTYKFIALDYDNPEGIRYWYKIPEISDAWVSLDQATSMSIGRLSPGTYNFRVKASNDAGLWSEEIHAPEIRILPPFWKTWWFISGMLVLTGSLIFYFIRMRRLKTESELRLRNQIARDLHDDIGSTLSGIKIFSNIASDMAVGNAELSPLLQQISDKSDTMMQSMSDIVWSINPMYDSLHDMMIRLKQYMSEMLESQNIDVQFSSHVDLKNQKIDLGHRKELYLALKEIINNTAKHSAGHNFIFDVTKQRGEIVINIQDDGIGMDENQIIHGNGLNNIEARIKQIGGKVKRESAAGKGTRYEIRVGVA